MTERTPTETRSVMGGTLPFALPIGLSAFLLVGVQLLIGRLALPVFGGTPAVWATVLFFFQALLFAGYLYGHLSVTRFGRWGPPAHAVLVALALGALVLAPTAISASATRSAIDETWALAGFIGLPALVLGATTPLLSSWLAAGRDRDEGPNWPFALANAGALLALLVYPLLIEPRLGLGVQRLAGIVAFIALGLLLARATLRMMSGVAARPRPAWIGSERTEGRVAEAIDWPRRGRWLLLAAVPSGLLVAITNIIAADLISAPLVWVIPLGIYLVTLILAFSRRAGRVVRWAAVTTPAAVTLLWVPNGAFGAWPVMALIALDLIGFLVVATGLHGRLAQDRPHPSHLSGFYLALAGGAVLGSAFVTVVAPTLFPDTWEYPILLVAGLATVAVGQWPAFPRPGQGLTFRPFLSGLAGRILPYAIGAAILGGWLAVSASPGLVVGGAWLGIGGLVLLFGGRPWFLATSTAVVLVLSTFVLQPTEFRGRSFFGATRVVRSAETGLTTLVSGMTVHGSQWIDPAKHRIPTSHYAPGGPAEDVFQVGARQPASGAADVAVVGLGAGELSAYMDVFTVMTYFEIDPVVVRIAQDPTLFTYLADAPGQPRIVTGDARRSLAAEPDGAYDLLVLDTFSSSAVPVHLLTVEAIEDQLRTLASDGVIAFHLSNRFYDLGRPVAAALEQLGLTPLERRVGRDGAGELESRWLATSKSGERLAALRDLGWVPVESADRPFTDDYADLLSILRLEF